MKKHFTLAEQKREFIKVYKDRAILKITIEEGVKVLEITKEQLMKKTRAFENVYNRRMLMDYVRVKTSLTSNQIGVAFDQDHATVLHSRRKLKAEKEDSFVLSALKEFHEKMDPIVLLELPKLMEGVSEKYDELIKPIQL